MQKETELEWRERLLREQKEALLGLQSEHVESLSNYGSDEYLKKRNTVKTSGPNFSIGRVSLSRQRTPAPNCLETAVCSGIDIPPSPNDAIDFNQRRRGILGRRQSIQPIHPELLGDDNFAPGKAGWFASKEKLPGEDGISSKLVTPSSCRNAPLSFEAALQDEEVTLSRRVTAINFHKKFEDIVVSAHGERSDGKIGGDLGTVALWALDGGRGVLQRSLCANSPVTAIELMDISPTLVIGGTRSGNIVMWDTRVKSCLPIKTFGSEAWDPICSHGREMVTEIKTSSTVSPIFLSSATSGYLYKWSLSKPESPITRTIVRDENGAAEMNISCLDLPHNTRLYGEESRGSNRSFSVFAGGMDGSVNRLEGKGTSWTPETSCGKHEASVHAISAHPLSSRSAFLNDVVITASADWTIRLWLYRRGLGCMELGNFDMMENGAVYDVKWSSQHATVFAAGDQSGTLSLFDVSGKLGGEGQTEYQFKVPGSESVGISRVQWAPNSRYMCTGDTEGKVGVWTCNSSFAGLPGAEWMTRYLKEKGLEKS